MVSVQFAKAHKKVSSALQGVDSLSPEECVKIFRYVTLALELPCSILNRAIFVNPLVPPPSPPNDEDAFANLSNLICPALLQAPLLTALRVLLPALASVAELHCPYIMSPNFCTKHKLDYLFEAMWEYLHPTQVSLAPYPVNIPPTPPSFYGNPNVPLVDSSLTPLTSSEIFNHPMADATDNSSSSEKSCKQVPTPCPLEKGKMCCYNSVTPSPFPAPLEPPIKLVSPAVTSAAPQGTSAGAPWGPPSGAAGQMGKTGKVKKGASFADIASKAAKKPGGAELPCQQSKIAQHFQPATTTKLAKPSPSPMRPSIVLSLTNHTLTLILQSLQTLW